MPLLFGDSFDGAALVSAATLPGLFYSSLRIRLFIASAALLPFSRSASILPIKSASASRFRLIVYCTYVFAFHRLFVSVLGLAVIGYTPFSFVFP